MSKELVISSNRHETKLAILEDDQLVEVYFQRSNEYSLAGSIHKGRVTRVLPGMQSAFVDLGLERDTFLYVSDFFEENEEFDPIAGEDKPVKPAARPVSFEPPSEPAIIDRAPVELAAEPVEAAAATPLIQERTEEGGDRRQGADRGGDRGGDRRGRRSRRRRNRGGGFPESKYATDVREDAKEEDSDAVEDEAPADVILLPGESLAKYSRPFAATTEPASEEPIDAISSAFDEPVSEEATEEHEAAPEIELPRELAAQLPVPEKIDIPETLPEAVPVAAEPAAPAGHETAHVVDQARPAAVTEVPAAPAAEPVASEPEAHGPTGTVASEPTAPVPATTEAVSAGPVVSEPVAGTPAVTAPVDAHEQLAAHAPHESFEDVTDEDAPAHHAEPASDLEFAPETLAYEAAEAADIEDEPVHVHSSIQDEVQDLIDTADIEEPEAVPGEEPAPQASASVREQGGRFPHRGSRRMRRRNRGGNVAESRGDQTTRQERPERTERPEAASLVHAPAPVERARPERERPPLPSITELLKEGQEIIVQIAKEPLGQKGARITSHIALPGRYVVFMPTLEHLGVSRKVSTDEERLRLKRILQTHRVGIPGGFIVRTAGEGRTEEEIAADMSFLYNLWLDIRQKAERRPAPILLHHDLDIVQRTLRDQLTEDFKTITVDSEELYESVLRFVQRFQPSLVGRIKLYTRQAPIFDAFNITAELEKALRPKVWLKSGGYIVINQTEALVAIDVNTGKYVGKSNRLEDTIVKTNTDAVKEIVRQIRLRDLGGIIVIDFIDMDERKNRQKVMQALEDAMRSDRAPYKLLQFNDFGLVAITRKRVKQSLERTLCAPCSYCEGAGYVKSVQTIISEILQEAHKLARAIDTKDVMLRVNPEVAKMLKSNENKYLEEIEEVLGRPVLVKSDPLLHHEKFDLV